MSERSRQAAKRARNQRDNGRGREATSRPARGGRRAGQDQSGDPSPTIGTSRRVAQLVGDFFFTCNVEEFADYLVGNVKGQCTAATSGRVGIPHCASKATKYPKFYNILSLYTAASKEIVVYCTVL
ncbi:unnamed protein product [Heligmosomoides polygyrus]|uniref:Histone domain-containing protein n=1 Tax=Heligmosomoides polygyrus TaxID=6339 RepID=A0A183GKH5_HELPZ|nr:unnamed protein product [Heligmosomoides polygyrus]